MRYIHPRVMMIAPANSRPMIGQITCFISAPFDWWYFCILPLIKLVELVSTNPISAIVGVRELVELSLTEFNSAVAKLKKLVDFLPVVPAPAIAELRVTDVQLMPEDSMEQSRGNFNL